MGAVKQKWLLVEKEEKQQAGVAGGVHTQTLSFKDTTKSYRRIFR